MPDIQSIRSTAVRATCGPIGAATLDWDRLTCHRIYTDEHFSSKVEEWITGRDSACAGRTRNLGGICYAAGNAGVVDAEQSSSPFHRRLGSCVTKRLRTIVCNREREAEPREFCERESRILCHSWPGFPSGGAHRKADTHVSKLSPGRGPSSEHQPAQSSRDL